MQTTAEAGTGRRPARTIAFFGHDRNDSTIAKRVAAFERHGSRVLRFMFRRERPGLPPPPDDGTVELGITRDLHYLARLRHLARAVARLHAHRRVLRNCDIFYARNLDMLAIAALARTIARSRAPLVYESLDVRRVFIGNRPLNRLFRFLERRLLAVTDLLVASSPEYVARYYGPVQGYTGPWRLIENKIATPSGQDPMPVRPAPLPPGPPWVIGWFGVLKCRRSLDILACIAERLGDKVAIHVRGILSESDIPPALIAETTRRHSNVRYFGPYANPAALAAIYGQVHLTWAADFLDPDANSAWCLPNRLYEGGAMGSVLVASRGTATGARIERDRLGWALGEPLEETAPAFLEALTPEAYSAARERLGAAPRALFYDIDDTLDLLATLDALPRRNAPTPSTGPIRPMRPETGGNTFSAGGRP